MSEQNARGVGPVEGDEIPAAVPVVVGGGGGPELGRSPSGGEPPPPTTVSSTAAAGTSWAAHDRDDLGDEGPADAPADGPSASPVRLGGRYVGRSPRLAQPAEPPPAMSPQQRLLLLDTWQRSGLPAGDFADLVGINKTTLLGWQRRFDAEGPAGLMDKPKGPPPGSKLPELTKRTILMLKTANPDWGCQRISDMLVRGPALPASASAVARVLHEAGYVLEEVPTRPHPDHVRSFERAKPNQLWQTDLFTFMLKRQNRRVHLVAFLDDHSRYIVGFGLHASASTALVIEVLRAAITNYGPPEEVLTDNGPQYVTWRGKSAFSKELEARGVKQVVASPRRPQTLGKVERLWGTLWRECLQAAVFADLTEARQRIGLFIDHYNFQRPHQGVGGLVPADRYFGAAPEVLATLRARVAANALELARHGVPKEPFYLTGQVGGQPFSVHAEGERVIMTGTEGRKEVELTAPPRPAASGLPVPVCPSPVIAPTGDDMIDASPAPGTSPLDDAQWLMREGGDS
jgi:transposase InsO family protein